MWIIIVVYLEAPIPITSHGHIANTPITHISHIYLHLCSICPPLPRRGPAKWWLWGKASHIAPIACEVGL